MELLAPLEASQIPAMLSRGSRGTVTCFVSRGPRLGHFSALFGAFLVHFGPFFWFIWIIFVAFRTICCLIWNIFGLLRMLFWPISISYHLYLEHFLLISDFIWPIFVDFWLIQNILWYISDAVWPIYVDFLLTQNILKVYFMRFFSSYF